MQLFAQAGALIEDWEDAFHQNGIRAALSIAVQDTARLSFRHLHFILFARHLTEALPVLPTAIPLEIRPLLETDIRRIAETGHPSEAWRCRQRLDQGYCGLLCTCQGHLAGYAWAYSSPHSRFEKVRLRLEPGDFVCDDAYTIPAYRRRGVQTAMALERLRIFRDRGYQRAICYIEMHNSPSLSVWQRKLGAQSIGEIDFLRIGPWYRVRVKVNPA